VKGNKKNILIWLLTWAVLSLVIIYSPIGSPELYRPSNYMVYNQGVNFNGGIANAPTGHSYQQYEEPDLAIPTYTPAPKTYTVNTSAGTSGTTGKTSYSVVAPANRTATTQSSGGVGSGGGFTFIGSHNQSAMGTSTPQTVNISSLSTDLSVVQDPTTRQLASNGTLNGGTDPGGDPTGPPIPVGDGFWVLLVMAGGYAIIKKKFYTINPQDS